ncbi:MAG: radical SAM protein [Kiritimatiellia bacterium]|nr:radical SAM protein [Lentisphaerota bacterium]
MNSKTTVFKHVFGPVPSRRLGRSLGVDLIPFKTCSYDCIYCQLGRTTHKTVERREYVPLSTVLDELRLKLKQTRPDYVTLSGSGEPTLYEPLGELIRGIRKITRIPLAVLTNGSLLWEPDVQQALLPADLVVPSLDGGDQSAFEYANRPHRKITFEKMTTGLAEFRKQYKGQLWLEVFLLGGVTAIEAEVAKIASIARRLKPDRIQLNTVTRPPAEDFAFPVQPARLRLLRRIFGRSAEVIAEFRKPASTTGKADEHAVLGMLARRPCTLKDISGGLGLHPTQTGKILEHLLTAQSIEERRTEGQAYFQAAPPPVSNRRKAGGTTVRQRKTQTTGRP